MDYSNSPLLRQKPRLIERRIKSQRYIRPQRIYTTVAESRHGPCSLTTLARR